MARILVVGPALQNIYLIDRDDFVATNIGNTSIFGQINIGDTVDIDKASYEVGGAGINAAVSFARHSHETVLMSAIGRDSAGDAITASLDSEGIDTSYLSYLRGGTGCSVIMLDAKNGERTKLTYRGVSGKLGQLDINDLDLIQPDWLYVTATGGEMDFLLNLFEKAHSLGIKIMFNPGPAELAKEKQLLGLLSDVNVLLVNKREAAHLVPGQVLAELCSHLANYVNTVIVTDGPMGGIATNHEETYRFGIYEDVKVKDPAGAGDAFGAGFLAHLANGASFKESLIFASANATGTVSKLGPTNGILTGAENLHLMPIQKI